MARLGPKAAHRLVGHVDTVVTPMDRRGYPPNQGSAGRKDPERIIVEHAGGMTAAQGDRIIALLERVDARLAAIPVAVEDESRQRHGEDVRRLMQALQRMVSN